MKFIWGMRRGAWERKGTKRDRKIEGRGKREEAEQEHMGRGERPESESENEQERG